jgi:hypothetical protein
MLFSQIPTEPTLRAPFMCHSPENRGKQRLYRPNARCNGYGLQPIKWGWSIDHPSASGKNIEQG